MFTRTIVGVAGCLLAVLTCASPVAALTQKECSEKYQAAKSAGTLGGKSWNDFRKTECAANAAPAAIEPATKPATTEIEEDHPARTDKGSHAGKARSRTIKCGVPNRGVVKVLKRVSRKSAHAHVP